METLFPLNRVTMRYGAPPGPPRETPTGHGPPPPLLRLLERKFQYGFAQHDLVARLQDLFPDRDAVDVGPVRGVAVLDLVAAAPVVDQRVPRLDRRVLEQVDV